MNAYTQVRDGRGTLCRHSKLSYISWLSSPMPVFDHTEHCRVALQYDYTYQYCLILNITFKPLQPVLLRLRYLLYSRQAARSVRTCQFAALIPFVSSVLPGICPHLRFGFPGVNSPPCRQHCHNTEFLQIAPVLSVSSVLQR